MRGCVIILYNRTTNIKITLRLTIKLTAKFNQAVVPSYIIFESHLRIKLSQNSLQFVVAQIRVVCLVSLKETPFNLCVSNNILLIKSCYRIDLYHWYPIKLFHCMPNYSNVCSFAYLKREKKKKKSVSFLAQQSFNYLILTWIDNVLNTTHSNVNRIHNMKFSKPKKKWNLNIISSTSSRVLNNIFFSPSIPFYFSYWWSSIFLLYTFLRSLSRVLEINYYYQDI